MATEPSEFEQLALDTLFHRRIKRQGCFAGNQAGQELRACPADVLPVIERVIRETVEPAISQGPATARALLGRLYIEAAANRRELLGLDYLLGAYLLIAARSDPKRAVRFLTGESADLQVEALGALRTFFRFMNGGYNGGIAPPDEFHAFARELARSGNETLRSAAEGTLHKVIWAEEIGTEKAEAMRRRARQSLEQLEARLRQLGSKGSGRR